jgi:hypothetical protein
VALHGQKADQGEYDGDYYARTYQNNEHPSHFSKGVMVSALVWLVFILRLSYFVDRAQLLGV